MAAVCWVCAGCWRLTGRTAGISTRLGRGGRQMSIFPSLPDISALSDKRREFSETRLIGCSPSEVYDVVADLNSYKEFLPWCQDSRYLCEGPKRSLGQLSIGFPPLLEKYTATVFHSRPDAMRTISTDGMLFTSLENHWQFRDGPQIDTGPTCLVNFWVMFEFRTLIYAQLGNLVFDEIARTMAGSFEKRCEELYGSHLPKSKKSLRTKLNPARTSR